MNSGAANPGNAVTPPAQKPPVHPVVRHRTWIVPVVSIALVLIAGVAFFLLHPTQSKGTILATVNGVPIYREDIEATLALLPESYHTTEQRQSILNQTIDLRLLTQEAHRRGIQVAEADIDTRINAILEDTSHSLPELRLILESKNLTVQQFRALIRDQLLVEGLGQQAVLSRVSVSESEITASYEERHDEFVPPRGSARISHILVANETAAREIIAALNRGESFRDLAAKNSLDEDSKDLGGMIGIIAPFDAIDETFRNAALGLRENQYTRVPIMTGAGYHVILRNPDVPSMEEVRDAIQSSILRRKQEAAFAAFLEGLRSGAEVKLYTETGIVLVPRRAPGSVEAFAACIGTKATLYIKPWDEKSKQQIAAFGAASPLLTVVDCDVEGTRCIADNIHNFPTWVIDENLEGQSTLAELSKLTACPLPVVVAPATNQTVPAAQ